MDAATIYQKTAKGEEEVRTRKAKLPFSVRAILILIDGRRTAGDLQAAAQRMGVKDDCLGLLESQGFVERAQGKKSDSPATTDEFTRFREAQRFMNDTVVDALGIRSFFFTLKLEKCANRDDLRNLLGDYTAAITKGAGAAEAEVLGERAQELLR